ncbi:MAG: glycine zipper 2TM domain-containing protein [Gammaproteobacteria bacterium]|nr:glycine zipper 2TM domain-containing protein [Gammaproteobacteria bacterium]
MKTRVATLSLVAAALVAVQASPVHADDDGYGAAVRYGYAKVIRVEPQVRVVDVAYPQRRCWNEQVTRYESGRGYASATPTILGGIVGGVLGHQVGRGNGRTVGAIAGTLLGASVARDMYQNDREPVAYTDTVQRCQVRQVYRQEQQVDGYRVIYRFRGENYVTHMDHDPGERIRVQVAINPAD